MLNLWLIVPCYNEAARFQPAQFHASLDALPHLRFIFVNDGSRDETLDVLQAARRGREERILVIDQPRNQGKAEAVRSGMLAALEQEPQYVGFWDADLATPLEAITDLLHPLETTPALLMVFGARVKLLGRRIERLLVRHYLGRIFATAVSTMLGLPIYDTQCGAKLFRAGAELKSILQEPFLSRWIFDVEILARFIRVRNRDLDSVAAAIYEYPLHEWRDVAGSKITPGDFIKAIGDLGRIYWHYLR